DNTALQKYNASSRNAFILYIVTNLIAHVHKKVLQAGEICYMDASVSFDSLNTSSTFFYTSCTVRAFPLGLFITSDESESTLEKAIDLLKTILLPYAFFGHGQK
ncbi:13320_t:CDS:1, partial [Gigaspora margarita]